MARTFKELPLSFILSLIAGAISLLIAILVKFQCFEKSWGSILLALWALCPPVWFLAEFLTEFPYGNPIDPHRMERLKHMQSLSRNIWLAFIIILGLIMGADFKNFLTGS